MTRLPSIITSLALAGLLLSTSACTTAPAGGGPILAMGSVEDDIKTGQEAHPQVLQQYGGTVGDPALERYVQTVGMRLKDVSELAEIDFTFTVLDSEIVNAFALPGGYVYVSRGLLALAEDEAEVAGVIGHEIGHVTARHGAARQTTGGLLSGGLTILGVLAGAAIGGESGANLLGQLGQTAGYGLVQTYSRSQEYEADRLGVRYLDRAGYDPEASADFLEALGTNSQLQAKLAGRSGQQTSAIDQFFSSHPNAPDRVARARERAAERPGTGSARNRDAFLDQIDGLIYGQSPNQGFVTGQRFAHPSLRVAFEYPGGYQLINQSNAVIGRGDNRILLFDMGEAETAMEPRRYLEEVWLAKANPSNVETFRTKGGLNAAMGRADVKLNGQAGKGAFVAIQGPDRSFYRFTLVAGGISGTEIGHLRASADSLRRLSAAEAAELKPLRVRLVTVRSGDTIDDFARRMEVDSLPREHFITMNGLDRGRTLKPGERVKIVVRG